MKKIWGRKGNVKGERVIKEETRIPLAEVFNIFNIPFNIHFFPHLVSLCCDYNITHKPIKIKHFRSGEIDRKCLYLLNLKGFFGDLCRYSWIFCRNLRNLFDFNYISFTRFA